MLTLAALSGLLAVFDTRPAQAQSCQALASQLASLKRQNGSQVNQRYDRAFRQQQRELSAARQSFRGGCRTLFGNSRNSQCVQLRERIRSMEANLNRLDRLRGGSNPAVDRQIRSIEAKIRRQNCGRAQERTRVATQAQPSQATPNRTTTNRRTTARAPERRQQQRQRPQRPAIPGLEAGTFRTLCVRTCDGYYFPISFSTTNAYFQRDLEQCQQRCPAAPVELFTHRNPGETAEDMKSIRGIAYKDLDIAFKYRVERVKNCTCRAVSNGVPALQNVSAEQSSGLVDIAPNSSGSVSSDAAANGSQQLIPVPQTRAPLGEDPETVANTQGDFNPLSLVTNKLTPSNPDAEEAEIRQVGPRFFPDQ